MLILTTSATSQNLTVIPRFEPTGDIRVTINSDDKNAQQIQTTVTPTYADGYLTARVIFDASTALSEGQFYSVKMEEEIDSVFTMAWRGMVFCTDQTNLPKFSINDGKFTENTANDNEFLTI